MLLSCPFDQYRSGDRRRGHDRPKAKPVNIPTVPGSKQLRLKGYGSSSCILETSNKSDPSALSGSDEMTSSNVSLNYSSSENFYELEQDVSHDSIYATPTRFIPVSSHGKQRKIRRPKSPPPPPPSESRSSTSLAPMMIPSTSSMID